MRVSRTGERARGRVPLCRGPALCVGRGVCAVYGGCAGVCSVFGVCGGSGLGAGGTGPLFSADAGLLVSRGSCSEEPRPGQLRREKAALSRVHGLQVQGQGVGRAGGGSETVRKALPAAGRALGPRPSSGPRHVATPSGLRPRGLVPTAWSPRPRPHGLVPTAWSPRPRPRGLVPAALPLRTGLRVAHVGIRHRLCAQGPPCPVGPHLVSVTSAKSLSANEATVAGATLGARTRSFGG